MRRRQLVRREPVRGRRWSLVAWLVVAGLATAMAVVGCSKNTAGSAAGGGVAPAAGADKDNSRGDAVAEGTGFGGAPAAAPSGAPGGAPPNQVPNRVEPQQRSVI
jgi:hypothetical protein